MGSTPGNDLITRERMVSSVAVAGKEERNNDIWFEVGALRVGNPAILVQEGNSPLIHLLAVGDLAFLRAQP